MPEYASYEVWRSTRAYFKPGDPAPACAAPYPPRPGPDLIFEDGDAPATPPSTTSTWCAGEPARAPGLSNRIGEFDFAVTPGN